jgi:pimeloyl-ACP methyl ester carboxylesterase
VRDLPLLLLHGALGAGAQFDALRPALGRGRRVLAMDLEGHGEAPPRDRPFRMEHFVSSVLARLDGESIARADIFGYSMGGYVALLLASEHPRRVGRVATLGTKFRWDPATAAREVAKLDPGGIRARVPQFAEVLAARHQGAGGWERVLAATADLLRALGDDPPLREDVLATIPHEVLVMVGDRDTTVSAEESNAVARSLVSGRCAVLPETPHPLERVDAALLARMLESHFAHPPGM